MREQGTRDVGCWSWFGAGPAGRDPVEVELRVL